MMEHLKKRNPGIKAEVFNIISDETNKVVDECSEGLIETYISIYDKHFTDDEIKGLLKFFDSSIGKKVIAEMPDITKEGKKANSSWRESIIPILNKRVADRLKKEKISNIKS